MSTNDGQYQHISFRLNLSNKDEELAYNLICERAIKLGTENFPAKPRETIVSLIVHPDEKEMPENPAKMERLIEEKLNTFGRWLLQSLQSKGALNADVMRAFVPEDTHEDDVSDTVYNSLFDDFNRQ